MRKYVIFDLDGTLLDTREGILKSVKCAAEEMGYPELPHETLLSFVGPPIQNSFMMHYGCDSQTAQRAANLFRGYYKSTSLFLAVPYPGIYELCEALKADGVRQSVATYKREDYAVMLLRHFSFDRYCDPMHGADNENVLKKQDIIRLCMDEMHAEPQDCLYVGDTAGDAAAAEKAGVPFLAVTYGFGFKTEDDVSAWPHIGVANTPLEIADYVVGRE